MNIGTPRSGRACELPFTNLFDAGRAFAFPCSADGQVDLDTLSATWRANYFYARALVGRDFSRSVTPVFDGDEPASTAGSQ